MAPEKRPVLGSNGAVEVAIDTDRLIETRLLVQANSGGGKSWALRRLLEQTHGSVQQLVLDVEGEFHTLREKLDYVIAGRDGGDCPAHPRAAATLAQRLVELGTSCILDLYELRVDERFEFVRRFLEAMMELPRNLWRPILVVIDEAHVFCPQHGEAQSAAAVIDLCTRGRKRGFAAVLATQRLSKLHKDAAAECVNKLVGRCNLDLDVKRAAEELGLASRDEQQALRRLRPGRFFAFGPALCDDVTAVDVGPVETTHPRAGERARPVPPPPEAVRALLSRLADVPKEAERDARTLDEALRRVRQLQDELRRAQAGAPSAAAASELVELRHSRDAALFELEKLRRKLAATRGDMSSAMAQLATTARSLGSTIEAIDSDAGDRKAFSAMKSALAAAAHGIPEPAAAPKLTAAESAARSSRRQLPARVFLPPDDGAAAGEIDNPMQRILDAMAWLVAFGQVEPFERAPVAFLARYKPGTGAFQNALGRLRSASLVEYPEDGKVRLRDGGRRLARPPSAPATVEDVHKAVLERIDGPMKRILRPLLDAHPTPLDRPILASRSGYQDGTGSFQNALGRLRSLGVIEYPQRGMVGVRGWVFMEASK